jgi:hypothetical protein
MSKNDAYEWLISNNMVIGGDTTTNREFVYFLLDNGFFFGKYGDFDQDKLCDEWDILRNTIFRDATPANKTRIACFESGSDQDNIEQIWQCSQLKKLMIWLTEQQPHGEFDTIFVRYYTMRAHTEGMKQNNAAVEFYKR